MLTFLSQSEKKNVRGEYLARLGTVAALLFTGVGVSAIVFAFPSYLFMKQQERIVNDRLQQVTHQTPQDTKNADKQLSLLKNTAVRLNPVATPSIYNTLEIIIGSRGKTALTSFSFDIVDTKAYNAALSGVAPTRDDLKTFTNKLSALKGISKVDLPISSFAQEKDIAFSVHFRLDTQ